MSHSINFRAFCIISSAPASSQCADSPDGHVAEDAGARTRCVWVFWSRARLTPELLAGFSRSRAVGYATVVYYPITGYIGGVQMLFNDIFPDDVSSVLFTIPSWNEN